VRVAILTYNAQVGDAIGNQVAEKLSFFLDRGADIRVFVESDKRLHPAVQPHCRLVRRLQPETDSWKFLASADLVLIEYGQYFHLLECLSFLARGKPRLLFDYHGVTPTELWSDHNREALDKGAQQRGLVWCCDAAIVHSRFTDSELRRPTAFPSDRVSVLEHPVDTKHFYPAAPRRDLRARLHLQDATLLLFVGRLAANKRVEILIEALARLHDCAPPVHLVIAGDDSDLYEAELHRCKQRAAIVGLGDRVHFLGHVPENALLDLYRSADLFVMPSRHEGFCIPVVEAMACGLPVLAARAGALPETVASAGVTFTPDDPHDLARQVRRILARHVPTHRQPASPLRVAIVAPRYGNSFAGGAERSLQTIADALQRASCKVEVFTTDSGSPAPKTDPTAIPVHSFPVSPSDVDQQRQALAALSQADAPVTAETERRYVENSLRSTPLVEALRERIGQFDAIIVGPYLYGLAFDVASAFPAKTLLLPCFHDEPLARLGIWREVYREVGGILYHSPEEKLLAEVELGLNHPGASCVGTYVEMEPSGDALRGQSLAGCEQPYLVYCGRYVREKNLITLLDYARRYEDANPGRYRFVFLGEGEVAIPRQPWARDLGFVEEACKRDILAGAAALIQLSQNESLSLVALEAWAQAVPVLAARDCPVMVGHLRRGGGGRAVAGYADFAAALDDLWQRPKDWQQMGLQGRAYIRRTFGSRDIFTNTLLECIRALTQPLAERMRQQGLQRAAQLDRSTWRERFGRIVEELLHHPARPKRDQLEVRPRTPQRIVSAECGSVLVPVRIANQGTHAVLAEGPGRLQLRAWVVDERGQPCGPTSLDTPLPGLLVPGQEAVAAVRVPVPTISGSYRVAIAAVPAVDYEKTTAASGGVAARSAFPLAESFRLIVEQAGLSAGDPCCATSLQAVHQALRDAELHHCLPVEYLDVTQGFLARWKHWIKRKLLGNFKHAYVDVLSRQQSAFNRKTLSALQELAECCAVLDHALAAPHPRPVCDENQSGKAERPDVQNLPAVSAQAEESAMLQHLLGELTAMQRRLAHLERRVRHMERMKS